MIVSLLGAANAILMIASRVPYAMGADRLAPAVMARVNAGGTPTVALLASAAVALALLLTGTFATVLALAAFFFVLNYAASFASLFVLRRREPGVARPYRAVQLPGVPGDPVAAAAGGRGPLICWRRRRAGSQRMCCQVAAANVAAACSPIPDCQPSGACIPARRRHISGPRPACRGRGYAPKRPAMVIANAVKYQLGSL